MTNKTKKIIWGFGAILGVLGLGWWIYKSVANMPGVAIADLGRDHKSKEENDKFVYNSYPPTSGPHDVDWIKPGVYSLPQDKYKLIHSLEHGYVVVHYNCEVAMVQSGKGSKWFLVKAHEDEGDVDNDSTPSAQIKTDCELGKILADFGNKVGMKKFVVTADESIKFPIVMTAWNRILEMKNFDEKVATDFVNAFRNKGPELTME